MFHVFGERYMQYLAAFLVSILTISTGTQSAWTSPILPMLTSQNSPIGVTLTMEESSWITSVSLLGYVVGNIGLGKLLDRLGRKKLLLMSAVPIVFGWMMILFAKNSALLIIARFINGIAHVVPTLASVIYIGEIAEADIRGKLGMFNLLMTELGQLYITVVGNYCSYQTTAIAAGVIPIVFVVTFCWMPESPYYHMRKGEVDNARQCLTRLRANSDVEKELMEIQYNVEKEMKNNTNFLELFRKPNYRKTVLLILGLKTLQQMSGNLAINSYMKIIFNQASTGLGPSESSIIATGISIPAMIVASYIIDCGGRKPLYYVSTLGLSLALFCEATYFYLQNIVKQDMTSLSWMPLSGVFFFNIFRVIGVQPLPYILTSELFPINIKGHAAAVTLVYSSLLGFLVSLGFPYVTELWDIYGGFLIFAIFCFLGFFFVLMFVPETKAKTLGDIQDDIEDQSDK